MTPLQYVSIAMLPMPCCHCHGKYVNSNMAMSTWQWQDYNCNIAMDTWQWKHGNGNIAICFHCHVAMAMLPLPCCLFHVSIPMFLLSCCHCHAEIAMLTLCFNVMSMFPCFHVFMLPYFHVAMLTYSFCHCVVAIVIDVFLLLCFHCHIFIPKMSFLIWLLL